MKVVFCSNYFNHHQQPLSEALDRLTSNHYTFLACGEMDRGRKELGWSEDGQVSYVRRAGDEDAVRALEQADVVLVGSAPERVIRQAIQRRKLVFRYSERLLKKGPEPAKLIPRMLRWRYRNPPGKPIYVLCASAFTAGDFRKLGMFRKRCYKWGYFPETRRYPDLDRLFAGKSPVTLLWCGRFLDWKHPGDALEVARRLREHGVQFVLKMIGAGPLEQELHQWVRDNGLQDRVEFPGSMSPQQVRDEMERSGIFLFTSDRREGWGAVLNEAMNSGCAVVASDAAGATPYLMKPGENGLVCHSGNVDELYEKVKWLLDHPGEQRRLGEAAYGTIAGLWNAETAAERFMQLSRAILDGDPSPDLFDEGPCSRAEIIREDWYQG